MAELARVQTAREQVSQRGLEAAVAPLGRAPLWQHFQPGQLLELSGTKPGKLSTVARLLAHAQAEGEPVAWVAAREQASFYPPDFAQAGVDLASLVVVRMPMEVLKKSGEGAHALLRASEILLRSGAFGLLVVDLGTAPIPRGELAWQARLSGLLRRHEARAVLLTPSPCDKPSLGPLIAMRVEPLLSRQGRRVVLEQQVLKSKLGSALAAAPAVSPDVRTLPLGAA